jgi:hypothetical protein
MKKTIPATAAREKAKEISKFPTHMPYSMNFEARNLSLREGMRSLLRGQWPRRSLQNNAKNICDNAAEADDSAWGCKCPNAVAGLEAPVQLACISLVNGPFTRFIPLGFAVFLLSPKRHSSIVYSTLGKRGMANKQCSNCSVSIYRYIVFYVILFIPFLSQKRVLLLETEYSVHVYRCSAVHHGHHDGVFSCRLRGREETREKEASPHRGMGKKLHQIHLKFPSEAKKLVWERVSR